MRWVRRGYLWLEGAEPFKVAVSTKLGFPPVEDFLFLSQVHSAIIQVAPFPEGSFGDGAVAREGVVLAVKTADCYPLLLLDFKTGAYAAIHLGWRGALLGAHRNALDLMAWLFGTEPSEVVAALGPGICQYRVGPEVGELFPNYFNGKFLDLKKFIIDQLEELGVLEVISAPWCTEREPWLWSARRDGYLGRLWSFVWR